MSTNVNTFINTLVPSQRFSFGHHIQQASHVPNSCGRKTRYQYFFGTTTPPSGWQPICQRRPHQPKRYLSIHFPCAQWNWVCSSSAIIVKALLCQQTFSTDLSMVSSVSATRISSASSVVVRALSCYCVCMKLLNLTTCRYCPIDKPSRLQYFSSGYSELSGIRPTQIQSLYGINCYMDDDYPYPSHSSQHSDECWKVNDDHDDCSYQWTRANPVILGLLPTLLT